MVLKVYIMVYGVRAPYSVCGDQRFGAFGRTLPPVIKYSKGCRVIRWCEVNPSFKQSFNLKRREISQPSGTVTNLCMICERK